MAPSCRNLCKNIGLIEGPYMMKAVMNGRGDEVIDLARTNLFR